ncbi:MAG: hypothetical protein EAX91_10395 [Candidatus Lokiarchaeota archaeon]|nr:hypothetical protein [Candidatus Lokiarchaeota archaeon]
MKSLLSYFFSHILINILVNYKLITFIIIWRKNYKYAYKYANWIENLRVYEEHRNHNIIHDRLLKTANPILKSGFLSFKKEKLYFNYGK